jgi:hypothetical protein
MIAAARGALSSNNSNKAHCEINRMESRSWPCGIFSELRWQS